MTTPDGEGKPRLHKLCCSRARSLSAALHGNKRLYLFIVILFIHLQHGNLQSRRRAHAGRNHKPLRSKANAE